MTNEITTYKIPKVMITIWFDLPLKNTMFGLPYSPKDSPQNTLLNSLLLNKKEKKRKHTTTLSKYHNYIHILNT